jgi:hypothetical protein
MAEPQVTPTSTPAPTGLAGLEQALNDAAVKDAAAEQPDAAPAPSSTPVEPAKPTTTPTQASPSAPASPLEAPTAPAKSKFDQKVDSIADTAGAKGPGAEQFNNLKRTMQGKINQLQGELKNTRTQLETFQSLNVEELSTRNKALTSELRKVAIERDPEFQAQFKGRQDGLMTVAQSIVGQQGAEGLREILSTPDGPYRREALAKLTADMDPVTQQRLHSVVGQWDNLEVEKIATINQQHDLYDRQQEQQRLEQAEQQQALANKLDASRAQFAEAIPALQHRENDDAYNQQVDNAFAVAQAVVRGSMNSSRPKVRSVR